ncbi:putative late blight resistance protein homolog R1A-3 isoform X2 [Salvia miltiorrhiza]|uniref:putative late blight resistance protein homolog R1A-3 isoform X2 n=1 Tax=Salvia miltiorrhiza TaxID=226208 RepID=UPI0025ACD29C|nr:putative late blight resistance protein homolog R1A-3 isoform X2 [Salvia miltiorrhiza]
MAYAALVSLTNTIDRFLNSNLYSISVEEEQQITSLLEYVTPFQDFLDKFPDKFKSLEERMREAANEAEDILEYLVLEKVFLSSDQESELHDDQLDRDSMIEDTILKLEKMLKECGEDILRQKAEDNILRARIRDVGLEVGKLMGFLKWYRDHIRFRDKWRFLPAKYAMFKSKRQFINHLKKKRNEIDSIMAEVIAMRNISDAAAASSSELAPVDQVSDESAEHHRFDKWKFLPGKFTKFKFKHHLKKIGKELFSKKNKSSTIEEDIVQLGDSSASSGMIALHDDEDEKQEEDDEESKLQSIKQLTKMGNEFDLIDMKNNSSDTAASSSGLAPADRVSDMISLHDDDDDEKEEEEEEEEESECYRSAKQEQQMQRVMQKIALIAAQVKEIKDSSSSKDVVRGGADTSAAPTSSSTDPSIHKYSMVGFEDYVLDVKDRLCGEPSRLQVIPICGMGGIGKTTLARNVYDDPLTVGHFVIRVWVTISQDYSAQRILSSLLESLKEYDTGRLGKSDDEKVHKILMGRRYLVVMDDMWSGEAWDVVRRVFPDDGNGSRVVLTTRLFEVASYPDPSNRLHEISLLNAEQSWNLLKHKVFADEECPSNLETIGEEIATSCKGLPLAIVVIAGLLSTVSKNPSSWQEIAEKVKSAKTTEHDQIEEILSLSYVELPQYLRPCFLYMATFPEDDEIKVVKLMRLWVAEGFLKFSINSKSCEAVAEECLDELMKRNLVLVKKRKSDNRIKSCSLHDLMRDLCIRKAHESQFFLNLMDKHVKKKPFRERIKNQRRVSLDSSHLRYLSDDDDSTIHSIRCSKYRLVKLNFVKGVRLLRVLDTVPADVKSSPSVHQLCELFHLRYLAINYMQSIPKGLSMLKNLQTLILGNLRRRILGVGVVDYLVLSWDTPQLRHVHFHGTIYFEDPSETTISLGSLQTLSYISHSSCTERILKKIPNLKKLKIDCSGGRHHEDAACLNDLVHLHRLESLKVYAGRWVGSRPKHYKISYPSMLKKLSLIDLRLPWSHMIVVGTLPNLQVLKLKSCTWIDGDTWETSQEAFPALEVLLIEGSGFENWITESSHFPKLKRLLLRSCWDLNGIPNDIGDISTLELIEVTGKVKESLMESVELIREEQEEYGNNILQVVCIAKS